MVSDHIYFIHSSTTLYTGLYMVFGLQCCLRFISRISIPTSNVLIHQLDVSWYRCTSAEDTESDTAVPGEKSNPVARPVGEGVYSLVRHHTATRTSTHLVYKLEHPGPHKKHEPQDALHIEPQASFVLQV